MTYELNQIFEGEYPPEVADFCNANRFVISELEAINGVRRFQITEASQSDEQAMEIFRLKQYLADTDYVVIKIAEGVSTVEDYADIIAERQKARERINELEN
jgi:hypothetical protein